MRYSFLNPKTYDALPDGRVRVYYDEVVVTETVTRKDETTGEETTETYPVYTYRAVDVESFDRSSVIVALIRAEYSADDELAIQRQRDDKVSDYNTYNAFVEKCKAVADMVFNGDNLATRKGMKIAELGLYDASSAVNIFTLNEVPMWLSPALRANLKNAVEALQSQGVTNVVFMGFTIPATDALQMLAAIEGYAAVCSQVTDSHRVAIADLESIADVERYDYTVGYPEVLNFTV